MTLPDFALIGRVRNGKDSVGDYLVKHHGYTRVAFVDAIKQAAYDTNPCFTELVFGKTRWHNHLASLVDDGGWERAKDKSPEVRRFLRDLGAAVRILDSDFWVNIGMRKVEAAYEAGTPVVVTDVRFRNEHDMLKGEAFRTVKILRPGLSTDSHVSETELSSVWTDDVIVNDGTLSDLRGKVDAILNRG